MVKLKLIAMSIELVGIAVGSVGVGLELAFRADAYLVVISVGSLIFASGGILYAKVAR